MREESDVSSEDRKTQISGRHDDLGWISFGAFLIVIAAVYLTTPNIIHEVDLFIRDLELAKVYQRFELPVPSANHPVLYGAVERFCYVFGLVEIGILVFKWAKKSSVHGKAETFSGVVFWLGAGYLFTLLSGAQLSWLDFLALLIVLVGISIISRALFIFASRRSR